MMTSFITDTNTMHLELGLQHQFAVINDFTECKTIVVVVRITIKQMFKKDLTVCLACVPHLLDVIPYTVNVIRLYNDLCTPMLSHPFVDGVYGFPHIGQRHGHVMLTCKMLDFLSRTHNMRYIASCGDFIQTCQLCPTEHENTCCKQHVW